jgi:hypothetical protein
LLCLRLLFCADCCPRLLSCDRLLSSLALMRWLAARACSHAVACCPLGFFAFMRWIAVRAYSHAVDCCPLSFFAFMRWIAVRACSHAVDCCPLGFFAFMRESAGLPPAARFVRCRLLCPCLLSYAAYIPKLKYLFLLPFHCYCFCFFAAPARNFSLFTM